MGYWLLNVRRLAVGLFSLLRDVRELWWCEMRIFISLPAQTLELFDDAGTLLCRYRVSTARRGAGEVSGSFRMPRGRHLIRARIGGGCPE